MLKTRLLVLVALSFISSPVRAAAAPSDWLKADGKGAEWTKQTAKCRELLARLKLDDPKVARYVPKIKVDCAMLARHKGGFNWRTVTGVRFLENMLADLAAGKVPNLRYRGKGVAVAYWSDLMQRIEAIWVHVPPGYDPDKSYQLFMCYKCGGGIHFKNGAAYGGYRPTAEVANKTDTFFAWSSLYYGVKGRMCAVDEVIEAIPAICRAFSVDPDRIFTTGYSDGGFTDLWLAGYYPHLFAGTAPGVANWQYSNVSQVGLYGVPMLVVDGWFDGGYNRENFARFHTLDTMGYDVAAVWSKQGHSYAHFEKPATFSRIIAWAKTRRRNLWPKRVRYATWNPTWHRAYWFTIRRFAEPCLPAQMDAQAKGNRIEVRAWNVAAYKLALSDKLVDPKQDVTIVTNGEESYSGPFKPELLIELEPRPKGKYVKDADTPGGIGCQIVRSWYGRKREGGLRIPSRAWLSVQPTGGDARTRELLKDWAGKWAKDDAAVTADDIAKRSLILFGGPDVNKLTARIAAELPVKFGKGKFTVGDTVYDRPNQCLKFIHPNPLNPKKYVIVYAFNDAATMAKRKFRNISGESAWTFRKGDCMVFNAPRPERKWGVALGGRYTDIDFYIFDNAWKPTKREILGEVTAPFDYTQILRLRADAVREATGADLGLIWAYTPSYIRWQQHLAPGPVTIHDLARTDALPEYIQLCEVKGSALYSVDERGRKRGILLGAPAATMAIKDVDPKKTYVMATNYHGLPAYGVNHHKMPDPFFFENIEEFLAAKHTSVPVRKLRQIPLTVNEAVAAYIKKRGKVAPRPVVNNLTRYLMNPQANEFAAYDWLHVGIDTAWRRAGRQRPDKARYTIAVGLGSAKAHGKSSKKFIEFSADGSFDFATLGKKLPVTVSLAEQELCVVAENGKYRLAAPGATRALVNCRVLVLRFRNKGKTDVAGVAALCPMKMDRIGGRVWPERPRYGRPLKSSFCGMRWTRGPYRKPPISQKAVLFFFGKPGGTAGVRTMHSVGYNFGLVGVTRPIAVKAGGTLSLSLLMVQADRSAKDPEIKLDAVLEAVCNDISAKLTGEKE